MRPPLRWSQWWGCSPCSYMGKISVLPLLMTNRSLFRRRLPCASWLLLIKIYSLSACCFPYLMLPSHSATQKTYTWCQSIYQNPAQCEVIEEQNREFCSKLQNWSSGCSCSHVISREIVDKNAWFRYLAKDLLSYDEVSQINGIKIDGKSISENLPKIRPISS